MCVGVSVILIVSVSVSLRKFRHIHTEHEVKKSHPQALKRSNFVLYLHAGWMEWEREPWWNFPKVHSIVILHSQSSSELTFENNSFYLHAVQIEWERGSRWGPDENSQKFWKDFPPPNWPLKMTIVPTLRNFIKWERGSWISKSVL